VQGQGAEEVTELPQSLINEVQKHTGAPWWNGHAYAEFKGYPQRLALTEREVGDAVDDISAVIEWLREEKQFDKADRLRTIAGRLARLLPDSENPDLIRQQAKGWT
jgi:hypothetical protein